MAEQYIGIIPAAGQGARLSPLPGSKELFPIGFDDILIGGKSRRLPKVVSQYLVDRMKHAGVEKIFFVLSEGKWDIMQYYGDGHRYGIHIAYLCIDHFSGMPFTINQAYPWVKNTTVVFGMPDTIFTPTDVYNRLLHKHEQCKADLTLGLFKTNEPWRFGMVKTDNQDRVTLCIDKPPKSELKYMWGIACWGPLFTEFMNNKLQTPPEIVRSEIVLGDIFQMAVDANLHTHAVHFEDGEYIDIGTPHDLELAVTRFLRHS